MPMVSYQAVFNVKQDFKTEILIVLEQAYEDSYIDDYDAATLEDAIQIKYEKLLPKSSKVIVGFEITLPEDSPEIEMLIASINNNLLSSSNIEAVFKFKDLDLFSKLGALSSDLFEIEMKLREAITFIFIDTYGSDYYNLLKEINVGPQFEEKRNLRKDAEQRKEFLSKRLENEFFHIMFKQYSKLLELKPLKVEELTSTIEVSKDFQEFKRRMIARGIIKEEYLDFISSIKIDMETLENVRNCVAHYRTPSDDDLANFEMVKEQLFQKIDNFLESIGSEKSVS